MLQRSLPTEIRHLYNAEVRGTTLTVNNTTFNLHFSTSSHQRYMNDTEKTGSTAHCFDGNFNSKNLKVGSSSESEKQIYDESSHSCKAEEKRQKLAYFKRFFIQMILQAKQSE